MSYYKTSVRNFAYPNVLAMLSMFTELQDINVFSVSPYKTLEVTDSNEDAKGNESRRILDAVVPILTCLQ